MAKTRTRVGQIAGAREGGRIKVNKNEWMVLGIWRESRAKEKSLRKIEGNPQRRNENRAVKYSTKTLAVLYARPLLPRI